MYQKTNSNQTMFSLSQGDLANDSYVSLKRGVNVPSVQEKLVLDVDLQLFITLRP